MKKVLLLGSGGLRIGQAGEFDYSGSQAIKAFKEENLHVVLINPNIATVQTDPQMADQIYLQPLNLSTVKKIIEKERPHYLALSFGGQTALNLGLELDRTNVLQEYGVSVLGTTIESIRETEDRDLFKQKLLSLGIKTPFSYAVRSVEEALAAAEKIGYPIMLRAGFSLGGMGSGRIETKQNLEERAREALSNAPQILIEEYLSGWKELEYEVVRDALDQTLTICNMENLDPMGIHTGESIVVAPSQTLNNREYHMLRDAAIECTRLFKIQGECNVQFALCPKTGEYQVIEMNARLSRSSALASKATGYPLAFIAAKLMLGRSLDQIPNAITEKTTAFFEPALDYVVVKIPRWDTQKLKSADRTIGSEMKSVGEVMAIGRSFPEALQKGVRMLNIGADGFRVFFEDLLSEIKKPTDRRLFALYQFFKKGGALEEAQKLTLIDPWFLHHLQALALFEKTLIQEPLDRELLTQAKRLGFSDSFIALLKGNKEEEIRHLRKKWQIVPVVKQIDTLAGEFEAKTNYLYMTYCGQSSDVDPSQKRPILILGSGPYCIGSSVEFDWCAVNAARTLRKEGFETLLINSNPETVSTDFDESDRLYFEELTLERVLDLTEFENPEGVIISFGGQIANNLTPGLHKAKVPILGTPPKFIDCAENRDLFSSLLLSLGIDQPLWRRASNLKTAKLFSQKTGYPILIRPSYVLSGSAMNIVNNEEELERFLLEAARFSPDHPIVLSKFIKNAKELEIDGVAQNGEIVIEAISEHVENAGIHSGDATIVLPPQRLYLETIRRAKNITKAIVSALQVSGPFNIQFLAKDNELQVIECNLRSSRSFPFVSKVTAHNFVRIATEVLIQKYRGGFYETLKLDSVGMKTPQFSYRRLKGADPVAAIEMASTGEVAALGDNYLEAFFSSWLATEQSIRGKRILISAPPAQRVKLTDSLQKLKEQEWIFLATKGTHEFLMKQGISSLAIHKMGEGFEPNIATLLSKKEIDLIINIPNTEKTKQTTEGFKIRRLAIDHMIPLITNLQLAVVFLQCLTELDTHNLPIKSWRELVGKIDW